MSFTRSLGGLALSTLLLAHPAAAQESPSPPASEGEGAAPPAATPSSTWYGWQTLVSDAATTLSTIGLANVHEVANSNNGNGAILLTNLGVGFGLGGPLIHLAHGRPLIALVDLLVRAGGVTVGAFLGLAAEGSSPDNGLNQFVGFVMGGFTGATAAAVVDATALSWEKRGPAQAATVGAGFTIEPTLGLAPGGGTFGVQGRF